MKDLNNPEFAVSRLENEGVLLGKGEGSASVYQEEHVRLDSFTGSDSGGHRRL